MITVLEEQQTFEVIIIWQCRIWITWEKFI